MTTAAKGGHFVAGNAILVEGLIILPVGVVKINPVDASFYLAS